MSLASPDWQAGSSPLSFPGGQAVKESAILAWEIPWIEEPGGLQLMGLLKSWTRLKRLSSSSSYSAPGTSWCVCLGVPRWLPRWPTGKEVTCQRGDPRNTGLIPGSERSPGGGNGNPLQYSCLDNFMNREAWWVTVHGVTESQT